MTAYRYECHMCEEPRTTVQIKQCTACKDRPVFVGCCCLNKHARAHPGQSISELYTDPKLVIPLPSSHRPTTEAAAAAAPEAAAGAAPILRVKRKRIGAVLPKRATPRSAGFDLASVESVSVAPQTRALIDTGLVVAIPSGYYGRIVPRSGLAVKNSIDIGAGVIDEDYRGELKVCLINSSTTDTFKVEPGDYIAQLILEKYAHDAKVREVQELDKTERAEKGFGSSGK